MIFLEFLVHAIFFFEEKKCYKTEKLKAIISPSLINNNLPSLEFASISTPSLVTQPFKIIKSKAKLGTEHFKSTSFPMMTNSSLTRVSYFCSTAKKKEKEKKIIKKTRTK